MVIRADSQTAAETGKGAFSCKLFMNRWAMDNDLANYANILHRIINRRQEEEEKMFEKMFG